MPNMKNYIEDGLLMRKAPLLIYKEIYQRLQFGDLTKRERKELEKQLAKAKKMVDKTADIWGELLQ